MILDARFRAFRGKQHLKEYFLKAFGNFESLVNGFVAKDALSDGFVSLCNSCHSKRAFGAVYTKLAGGIIKFAVTKGLEKLPFDKWPVDLGAQFRYWLDTAPNVGDSPYHPNTARKYYHIVPSLFAAISNGAVQKSTLPDFDSFPNAYSGAEKATKTTQALGLSFLLKVLIAARSEFIEVSRKRAYADELLSGAAMLPLDGAKGSKKWSTLGAVIWALHLKFGKSGLPLFTEVREFDRTLSDAITRKHGGWRTVSLYFQPTAESLIPPLLLLYIYAHANTEPLRALKIKNIENFDLLKTARMALRFDKNRAGPYSRSFAIDATDPASPSSIVELMSAWTSKIRKQAGPFKDHLFIFPTKDGEIRPFNTAEDVGNSSDSTWSHHLKEFSLRNGLPLFTVSELRQTSIDFGWQISDDDIREMLALKGGKSEAVARLHYQSDLMKVRGQYTIGLLQSGRVREVRTGGKSTHRRAPKDEDRGSATPGCTCVDPMDSPIPGQRKDELCAAFGRCPGCPHGSPNLRSPYSLARMLQLRDELRKAKMYLSIERWHGVYVHVEAVVNKWLLLYGDDIWIEAEKMHLPPIGVLE
ncbi:hypothetical protein [Pelomonas sp. SE-A7]|uniref:hypothetical protein n=1 Tax=Pelomonas sp. SE-A7 TaxID=3054953 RepID=UPI00259D2D02|nr:hypothetical protein [Pelomonas sp. SE-A7]MDM4765989.1 hypothetical protein [Pelomonas sp. SE-A7]